MITQSHRGYPFLSFSKCQGATIIGLMIGLLVSMIGILGSLSLYKTLTRASVDATFDTKLDGNAAMAISRVAYEIQSAGFGLPEVAPGNQPHLKIIGAQEIIWRVGQTLNATDANVVCKKVREIPATVNGVGVANPDVDAGIAARKLILETTDNATTVTCNLTGDIANVDWANSQKEVLNITELTRLDATFSKTSAQALISFSTTSVPGGATCTPYGMVPTTQSTLINISHYSSADLNSGVANRTLSHDVCLGNTALASAPIVATP